MIDLTTWAISTLTAVATTLGGASAPPYHSWGVFYGASAPVDVLRRPDVLVLEPDHAWQVDQIRRPGQKILAYLSLGEVHRTRPYFQALADTSGALLGANPDWPDAQRVDPRSPAWRHLVLDELAPELLARGYDGFFLDTLDAPPYLESRGQLPGGGAAIASLVVDLKARYPSAMLLANGGVALLPRMASALSGLAAESVLTSYHFDTHRYGLRPPADAEARRRTLTAAASRHGLPLFVLEYVDPADRNGRAEVARKLRSDGFIPFIADIGLGTLDPLP